MSENKNIQTKASVAEFLKSITDDQRRKECKALAKMMKEVTGKPAKMWGESMVGFGSYHYKYDSGREGDSFLTGFSPRKQNLTIYIMPGFKPYPKLMKKLGKFKSSVSCLYLKRLDDIDMDTLKELVKISAEDMSKRYK